MICFETQCFYSTSSLEPFPLWPLKICKWMGSLQCAVYLNTGKGFKGLARVAKSEARLACGERRRNSINPVGKHSIVPGLRGSGRWVVRKRSYRKRRSWDYRWGFWHRGNKWRSLLNLQTFWKHRKTWFYIRFPACSNNGDRLSIYCRLPRPGYFLSFI